MAGRGFDFPRLHHSNLTDWNTMANPEMVTIPLNEYLSLKEDAEWLQALENAGVDNWSGIDFFKTFKIISLYL